MATTIAVLAIATFGLLVLSGRNGLGRSARVIFGCCMIFGASRMAGGIHSVVVGETSAPAVAEVNLAPYYPPAATAPHLDPEGSDPYAGAAVPRR